MFCLICAWTNGWVYNWCTSDLRCHCTHYDVTVMCIYGTKPLYFIVFLCFLILCQKWRNKQVYICNDKWASYGMHIGASGDNSVWYYDNYLQESKSINESIYVKSVCIKPYLHLSPAWKKNVSSMLGCGWVTGTYRLRAALPQVVTGRLCIDLTEILFCDCCYRHTFTWGVYF